MTSATARGCRGQGWAAVAAVYATAAPVVALLFCCVLPPFHQTEPAAPLVSNWSPGRPVYRQVQAVTQACEEERGGGRRRGGTHWRYLPESGGGGGIDGLNPK